MAGAATRIRQAIAELDCAGVRGGVAHLEDALREIEAQARGSDARSGEPGAISTGTLAHPKGRR